MLDFIQAIRAIYTRRLENKVAKGRLPRHIMIVADDMHVEKFSDFAVWCEKFGIEEITICVQELTPELEKFAEILNCRLTRGFDKQERLEKIKLNIVALSGRAEIIEAVKRLAELVEKGELNPDEVDEKLFEAHLRIKSPPDLIIRAGAQIPDFLIWQSIYSELHFLDTDWKSFRYIDFLRCLRDYQRRERRYGK
ncbi:MAG: di-trans,poly-cis-decaprenylcistransferase [Archaeoglobales archaeon]|nr:MAG: di-trans,poly-cis-decaprenylcistransferase [Archaeoglobales archaeon]